MSRTPTWLLFLLVLLAGYAGGVPVEGQVDRWRAFSKAAASRIGTERSVRGHDPGWLFLRSELRHVATGNFWERPWEEVAANRSDPVPHMVSFAQALAARGVRLVLVPVPAKAAVYADKLDGAFSIGEAWPTAAFYEGLGSRGVEVLDVEKELLEIRSHRPEVKLYCEQDAHFSPFMAAWMGEKMAALAADETQVPAQRNEWRLGGEETLVITGDQIAGSEWEGRLPGEELSLRKVIHQGAAGVTPDPQSPVLVLGDSHTLVFHEGAAAGMHCDGAGLVDHLSYHLGRPVDLVGVRGSGLVAARKQLYYHATSHGDYWKSKKVVFWVFSVREFTQSSDKLVKVPLDK